MGLMVDNDGVMHTTPKKKRGPREVPKKIFEICYTNICYVTIEADTPEEAMEKFEDDPSAFDDTLSIEAYQDPSINREE